jgi:hypothetical protein
VRHTDHRVCLLAVLLVVPATHHFIMTTTEARAQPTPLHAAGTACTSAYQWETTPSEVPAECCINCSTACPFEQGAAPPQPRRLGPVPAPAYWYISGSDHSISVGPRLGPARIALMRSAATRRALLQVFRL